MRKFVGINFMFMLVLCASAALAQVRGTGRLQGIVTEKGTGKPIAGATVTIGLPSGSTQPIVTKTDSKGRWSALGLTSGQWNVDVVAPGFEAVKGSVSLSSGQMVPPIRTELAAEAHAAEAEAAPMAATPKVPKEAIDAVNEAQGLLKINVGDVVTSSGAASHTATAEEVKDNAKRAVADLEKAMPMIPTDSADLLTVSHQVQQLLSQAYYRSGDVKKSISLLESLNQTDPWTTPDAGQLGRSLLLANLYLENGQLSEGKALLDKLPEGAVSDPTVYINVGILFMNKKNPGDATAYFTKAIALDSKRAESFYYRGLAEAQMKKIAEARTDFQQVLTMAPDSPEAHDAKAMLDSLPKK